jgi:hypothetical protein
MKRLDVVIPVFNEAATIVGTYERALFSVWRPTWHTTSRRLI